MWHICNNGYRQSIMMHLDECPQKWRFHSLLAASMVALLLGAGASPAQNTTAGEIQNICRAIQDDTARQHCLEFAAPNLDKGHNELSESMDLGGWRVVRTRDPAGRKDAVSITHTPDALHSDPDLAGLMIRCAKMGNQVLIAVISPLPPQARLQVVLGDAGHSVKLEGKVIPPGAAILLPIEAAILLGEPWHSMGELPVKITGEGITIQGTILLKGLAAALDALATNCPVN
jgi:hypothetical protein